MALKNIKPKAPPSNVIRLLSTVAVINNAAFDNLTLVKRTEALSKANGKPVLFVPSFGDLSNPTRLIDSVIAGKEDALMRLEFNGIEMTAEESETVRKFTAFVDRVRNSLGELGYKYLEEGDQTFEKNFSMDGNRIIAKNPTGNTSKAGMTRASANRLWKFASYFWHNGEHLKDLPKRISGISGAWMDSSMHKLTITEKEVRIGCTTVTRLQVELVAKKFEWEPTINV